MTIAGSGAEPAPAGALRSLLTPGIVALGLMALMLGVARWWSFDVGEGPEMEAEFELGPLGPDRTVVQTLRAHTDGVVGIQVLARAVGTLEPLTVVAELRAGGAAIAKTTTDVFPAPELQLARFRFPVSPPAGELEFVARTASDGPGGVLFGATRSDRYPDGMLLLDGASDFPDQDLAHRPLYHRSTWQALELAAADGPAAPLVAGLSAAVIALLLGMAAAEMLAALRG